MRHTVGQPITWVDPLTSTVTLTTVFSALASGRRTSSLTSSPMISWMLSQSTDVG